MTKRVLLCLPLFILFIACKKGNKPAPTYNYNITGNWTLYSYATNYGGGVNASVAQYPCMAYNVLTFYTDSTSSQSYSGIDTCFITPSHTTGAQYFGLPGLVPSSFKWSLRGSVVYLIYADSKLNVHGTISNVSNKLQLTIKDTVKSGTNTYYITSVEVKQ